MMPSALAGGISRPPLADASVKVLANGGRSNLPACGWCLFVIP